MKDAHKSYPWWKHLRSSRDSSGKPGALARRKIEDRRSALLPFAGLAGVFAPYREGHGLAGEALPRWLGGGHDKLTVLDRGLSGIDGVGDQKRQ